jgi:MYXO-CTERM domain-containing protein
MQPKRFLQLSILAALPAAIVSTGHAAYTTVWSDSYDTTVGSFDINTENATRQSGVLGPISYVANVPTQSTDFHQQVLGTPGPLLLAGDGGIGTFSATPSLNTVGYATVSPNYNFKGLTGGGEVIGKQITVDVDVFGAPNTLSSASITIAGNSTLEGGRQSGQTSGLTVKVVEDTFSNFGNFIQLYDAGVFLANFFGPPAGSGGWMNIRFDVNDPTDQNPWDGVGQTSTDIYINNTFLVNYTKLAGGYTNNYITLEGTADFVDFSLTTHLFDNLTVSSSPIPEPSAALLGGLGLLGLLRRRRA